MPRSANLPEFMQLLQQEAVGGEEGDGEDEGPPVVVTPAEEAAIARLMALGFDRMMATQAFFACDKNEEARDARGAGGEGDHQTHATSPGRMLCTPRPSARGQLLVSAGGLRRRGWEEGHAQGAERESRTADGSALHESRGHTAAALPACPCASRQVLDEQVGPNCGGKREGFAGVSRCEEGHPTSSWSASRTDERQHGRDEQAGAAELNEGRGNVSKDGGGG